LAERGDGAAWGVVVVVVVVELEAVEFDASVGSGADEAKRGAKVECGADDRLLGDLLAGVT